MGDVAVDLGASPSDVGYEAPDLEGGESGAEPGADPGQTGAEAAGDPGKEFRAVLNGKLDPAAKVALEKLKLENPQLAKAVQRALFAEDRLRKELPSGFKEVAQLRKVITDIAGDRGPEGVLEEVNGYRDFDAKLLAGDPAALETISATPGGLDALAKLMPLASEKIAKANPEAFSKFAVDAFEKYMEVHPEGYAAYIAQVMLADMGNFQYAQGQFTSVPSLIERLTDAIPADNAKAVQILGLLNSYVQRVIGISRKSTTPPKAEAAAGTPDPRAAELDGREQTLRREEWKSETGRQHARIFTEAWERLGKGVPKDKEALVRRLYGMHLQEKLGAKKEFNPNMDRYFQAKQKDGFLRLHESTFKEAVPLAIRSAMAEAGIGTRKAPAAPPPTNGAAPAAPSPGFTRVAQKPSIDEVAVGPRLTTADMWIKKQAVLKSGRRVTWA